MRRRVTQTKEEAYQKKLDRFQAEREEQRRIEKLLGVHKKERVKGGKEYESTKPIKAEKKRLEDISNAWRTYGIFIEPTKEQIEKELLLEELEETDEIDYITLDECIEKEDEDDGEEEKDY